MKKWDLVQAMKDYGFSDSDILDMFVYWSDVGEVEECVDDYLNDRDLLINERCEIRSK